ncbi:MAG: HEPN domain-containing protein [Candidatus Cloacimonetes bacterium]|nr:HEPN domain-containing protein [Candidatus Cloacimonadota bacterium]MBC8525396.1 HEPN domain-containing protein [Candidatus Cloacimonadota bacterium]
MDKKSLIKYWLESSDRDYRTMQHLFEKKDYSWSLFIGHLIIEKLLKAYYVKHIDNQPPFIHNLLRLAEKSLLELNENQKDFLVTVTTFNIRARYADYKLDFYRMCTKDFTEKWINEIKEFQKWIKEQLLKS